MNCESKAISVLMAYVSTKINGAWHVSGGVNSTIQFSPEVQQYRQRSKGTSVHVCVCEQVNITLYLLCFRGNYDRESNL